MPSKVVAGVNDIVTTHPDLASEWHPIKNQPLQPSETRAGTAKKIWWRCKSDPRHEWQATGDSRVSKRTGCPVCTNQLVIKGVNDLAFVYPSIAREWMADKNAPALPSNTSAASPKAYWWQCKVDARHLWRAPVYSRTKLGTGCPYCDGKKTLGGQNDLATTHPALAAEWHPNKNGNLRPSEVVAGTNKKIWWLCKVNDTHEWATSGGQRLRGRGCPFCGNQVLLKGFNDMATTHPTLADQWHPTKNLPLSPTDVFGQTGKKLWWQCPADKSHEWQATGRNRVAGTGCPFCSNRLPTRGKNDLATASPALAAQWDYDRNGDLQPSDLVVGSHKRVWWICSANRNHSWQATVGHRAKSGCPICGNRKVLQGDNDLLSTAPEIAHQWHTALNGSLLPCQVTIGSSRKVWWVCPNNSKHEWQTTVASRKTSGCPFCSNKAVLSGFNDLQTTHPTLAKEWDLTRNAPLLPTMVSAGSSKRAWWHCPQHENHYWQATISSRRTLKVGCPICANLQVLRGFNDFATTNPGLALEWHPTKNASLLPNEIVAGTQRVVWWQCLNNPEHSWRAGVKNRMAGTGCPACTNYGYQSTSAGLLYFIENERLRARKVGITNPQARADRLGRFEEAGWRTIRTWFDDDGLVILNLETAVLRWIRKDLGLPPFLTSNDMGRQGGWSETFSEDGTPNKEVIEKVDLELLKLKEISE